MKTTQDRLTVLLTRPGGATSVDIANKMPSVCPHKEVSRRAERGWKIQKTKVGKLIRYTGQPPIKESDYVPKTVWQPHVALAVMNKLFDKE